MQPAFSCEPSFLFCETVSIQVASPFRGIGLLGFARHLTSSPGSRHGLFSRVSGMSTHSPPATVLNQIPDRRAPSQRYLPLPFPSQGGSAPRSDTCGAPPATRRTKTSRSVTADTPQVLLVAKPFAKDLAIAVPPSARLRPNERHLHIPAPPLTFGARVSSAEPNRLGADAPWLSLKGDTRNEERRQGEEQLAAGRRQRAGTGGSGDREKE